MISFWLAVATLLTLTTTFIFWPLIAASLAQAKPTTPTTRAHKKSSAASAKATLSAQQQRNIEIFKERLQELEAEQQQGNLDAESFQQLKVELEKSLLNDVKQSPTQPLHEEPVALPHWLIAALISIMVIISSLAIYDTLGRHNDYLRYLTLREQGALQKREAPDFERAIALLTEKLQQDPTDLKKWYMLANSFAATQQYTKAADVFLRIAELVGKDSPDYAATKGAYAQALYLANHEQINDAVRNAAAEALKTDPQEANALVLQGIDAFEKNAYPQAIEIWQKAKVKANATMTEQFINPSIAAAQERLGIARTEPEQVPAASVGGAKLQLTVTLAPELKAKTTPEQVVFVYASPQGTKMPLAAQRLQVKDLPAKITLDDSKSVMPTAKLSSASVVDITARISLSGQATTQAGDLYARQSGVNVQQASEIALVIDQVMP